MSSDLSNPKDEDAIEVTIPDEPAAEMIVTARVRRGSFYALGFRNFRLFFIGQLISVIGTWMQMVAQQWLVWELTKSAAWLGIINGASAIPYVAFSMWGGQVADRLPRRTILVWTQVAAMLLAFILAALATNRWIRVQAWHIAVLAAFSGVVNAFTTPTQQAFVTDMVDEREALGNAIALNSLMFNLARFLGPILAGALLVKLGAAGCFGLNGLSYLAVIASLLMMRLPPFVPHTHRLSMWEGFAYIRSHRVVLRVILLAGAASLFAWSVSTLYPVFAAKFGTGAGGYTGIMAANGIGAALGGLCMAAVGEMLSRRLLIYGGAILFCGSLLLFTTAPFYWVALVWLALAGFSMISFAINANTKVQEEVSDALRGRVMAVYSLVFQGLIPVGGLEIGFLADHWNADNAVRFNATVCFLITLAIWLWSQVEVTAKRRQMEEE